MSTLPTLTKTIVADNDLTPEEARNAMQLIMSGAASETEMASFLTALTAKGESVEEITALASVMRDYATPVKPDVEGVLVDVCGTGGDGAKTFNISTTAMFVVAAASIPVAKHGNRSITSDCGSADVLEALGADLSCSPEEIRKTLEDIGIGFMFAPGHHPAMAHVMPVRKQLGFRTVFNTLGPLTNPAGAQAQLLGVYDGALTEKLAAVLAALGCRRAFVVHGRDGLDELSTTGPTKVSELRKKKVATYDLSPDELGLSLADHSALAGGSAKENATILKDVLAGKGSTAQTDIVCLNAAAAIVAGGKAGTLEQGLGKAYDLIEEGKAMEKLAAFLADRP